VSAAAVASPRQGGARAIAIDVALNVVLPYAAHAMLREAGQGEQRALLLSALVPVAVVVASLLQRRRINMLSLLVIGAAGLSLAASALSGSVWFTLVQPSFVTGGLALIFAGSLAARRPAIFYLARDTTCPTAEDARGFEAKWDIPGFRQLMRRLTIVWAAFLAGEATFRFGLAALWPNPSLIAATQVLWIILPVLLIRWSIATGKRSAARSGTA
jgi:hypothetical protein